MCHKDYGYVSVTGLLCKYCITHVLDIMICIGEPLKDENCHIYSITFCTTVVQVCHIETIFPTKGVNSVLSCVLLQLQRLA